MGLIICSLAHSLLPEKVSFGKQSPGFFPVLLYASMSTPLSFFMSSCSVTMVVLAILLHLIWGQNFLLEQLY